jgi:hypothetical protein
LIKLTPGHLKRAMQKFQTLLPTRPTKANELKMVPKSDAPIELKGIGERIVAIRTQMTGHKMQLFSCSIQIR